MKKIIILSFLFLFLFKNSEALSLVVNSTTDAPDVTLGDGICSDALGNCTLRAAIQEINAFGDAANDISLPTGTYILTIGGINEDASVTGDLDCFQNISINGTNATNTIIDGNGADRIFNIHAFELSLSKLTITNGLADFGGGIYNAAIGTVILNEVTVSSCTATSGFGGGIYNRGDCSIFKSTITSNRALGENGQNGVHPGGGGGGGAGAALGGGIYNEGNLIIQNSTISGNSARGGRGGNGSHHAGSGTVTSPGGAGGGISGGAGGAVNSPGGAGGFASGGGGGGSLSAAGGAGGFGGGGGAGGANSWGGNAGPGGPGGMFGGVGQVMCCSASGGGGGGAGLGGGIFNNGGTVDVVNVTIAFNLALEGAGGGGYFGGSGGVGQGVGGGVFNYNSGTVNLENTVVASNSADTSDDDIYGAFVSNNYNLIQVLGSAIITGVTTNNITGVDPLLESLAYNGGETQTHAFPCASSIFNAGQSSILLDQTCETRPQGAQSDIGALELILPLSFKE